MWTRDDLAISRSSSEAVTQLKMSEAKNSHNAWGI